MKFELFALKSSCEFCLRKRLNFNLWSCFWQDFWVEFIEKNCYLKVRIILFFLCMGVTSAFKRRWQTIFDVSTSCMRRFRGKRVIFLASCSKLRAIWGESVNCYILIKLQSIWNKKMSFLLQKISEKLLNKIWAFSSI